MRSHYLLMIFGMMIVGSCAEVPPTAQQVIDKSIEAYGGMNVYKTNIEFDFRHMHFRAYYNNGMISYERMFEDDSLGSIHDVLTNDGFLRKVNGQVVELDEEWTGRYTRSVNAVVYFFRLPFNLNDPAVNKKLLPETSVRGEDYHVVHISFEQDGGGDDYDDSFVYWINRDSYVIDYLAYSYSTDGGGKRFRVAMNPRVVDGLKVVDYINYKPNDLGVPIEEYLQYYQEGGLEELSRIENVNIEVTYLE